MEKNSTNRLAGYMDRFIKQDLNKVKSLPEKRDTCLLLGNRPPKITKDAWLKWNRIVTDSISDLGSTWGEIEKGLVRLAKNIPGICESQVTSATAIICYIQGIDPEASCYRGYFGTEDFSKVIPQLEEIKSSKHPNVPISDNEWKYFFHLIEHKYSSKKK